MKHISEYLKKPSSYFSKTVDEQQQEWVDANRRDLVSNDKEFLALCEKDDELNNALDILSVEFAGKDGTEVLSILGTCIQEGGPKLVDSVKQLACFTQV